MRQFSLTVLSLAVAAACFGQSGRTYSSVGGFGSVLYPGTGHAPNAVPGGLPPSFAHRLGGNVGGYPGGYPGYPPQVNHPGHPRNGVVAYPVFVGGYGGYGGYYDSPPQQPPQYAPAPPIVNTNSAPSVVINQTFIPDRAPQDVQEQQSGMRMYEGPRTLPQDVPQRSAQRSNDQPTLYLIAFKDHTIVPALGYWIESGNLHYVSAEHSLNQASLDLIDRDLSQQLNDERNVEFKLPKGQ